VLDASVYPDLIIEKGTTLTVRTGVKLSSVSNGGSITGQGTLIVEGTGAVYRTTVTDDTDIFVPVVAYSLPAKGTISTSETPINPSTLNIQYAVKDLATGVVTVKLVGTGVSTADSNYSTYVSNQWGNKANKAPDGTYSWAVIGGLLTTEAQGAVAIKQFNEAFVYYKDANNSGFTTSHLLNSTTSPYISIPADGTTPYKWKSYAAAWSKDIGDDNVSSLGVLFWSGAKIRQVPIEITPTSGTAYTVIVDWSGVTF
jgi:hypothetical protein